MHFISLGQIEALPPYGLLSISQTYFTNSQNNELRAFGCRELGVLDLPLYFLNLLPRLVDV